MKHILTLFILIFNLVHCSNKIKNTRSMLNKQKYYINDHFSKPDTAQKKIINNILNDKNLYDFIIYNSNNQKWLPYKNLNDFVLNSLNKDKDFSFEEKRLVSGAISYFTPQFYDFINKETGKLSNKNLKNNQESGVPNWINWLFRYIVTKT